MIENLNATRGLIFSGQLLLALTKAGVMRETPTMGATECDEGLGRRRRLPLAGFRGSGYRGPSFEGPSRRRLFSRHYLRNVDQILRGCLMQGYEQTLDYRYFLPSSATKLNCPLPAMAPITGRMNLLPP